MKERSQFIEVVLVTLGLQNAVATLEEKKRFAAHILASIRHRKAVALEWENNRSSDDIIGLIQVARDAGDLDEALWRCFLAAHFGRASAGDDQTKLHSASRFLNAFQDEPYWTWQRASTKPDSWRNWLQEHSNDLKTLSFGNHRKREAKDPEIIWSVMDSFMCCADEYGGPSGLIVSKLQGPVTPHGLFDEIFQRLRPLTRFGRLGAFDFVALLIDLNIVSAEPASCYLSGATGPLHGAHRLWGKRPGNELEGLTADLSKQLGVSPLSLEDALCNWNKK